MSQSEGERVEGVPLTVIACVERHREVPFQLSKIQPPNHLGATTFLYFYNRQTATRKTLSLRNQ